MAFNTSDDDWTPAMQELRSLNQKLQKSEDTVKFLLDHEEELKQLQSRFNMMGDKRQ